MFAELLKKMSNGVKLTDLEKQSLYQEARQIEDAKILSKIPFALDGKIGGGALEFPIDMLYSNVLTATQASITISVPSEHKHLLVLGAGRSTSAGNAYDAILAQFNGDTGANYTQQWLRAFTTTVDAFSFTGMTEARLGHITQGGAAAGVASAFMALIPHHRSDYFKNTILIGSRTGLLRVDADMWQSTAPITEIKFFPATASFAAGFLLSVYGIR